MNQGHYIHFQVLFVEFLHTVHKFSVAISSLEKFGLFYTSPPHYNQFIYVTSSGGSILKTELSNYYKL